MISATWMLAVFQNIFLFQFQIGSIGRPDLHFVGGIRFQNGRVQQKHLVFGREWDTNQEKSKGKEALITGIC